MAHGVIGLTRITLVDDWPGVVNPNLSIPTDGWDNTIDNFTTTVAGQTGSYPVGTKIMAYTDNSYCPGYYTMAYLMYHTFCAAANIDISEGCFTDGYGICAHYDASDCEKYKVDFSAVPYYVVANDHTATMTDATMGVPIALPCASLKSDGTGVFVATYGDAYGWFWVGGVCPCKDATFLDGSAGGLLGAEVACASMLSTGPVHVDWSSDRLYFAGHDWSETINTDASASAEARVAGYACTSTPSAP